MGRGLTICTLLLVAACAPEPQRPSLPSTLEDTCDARRYGDLIGQDATALEKVLIMGMVRVIRPGDAVSQDFRPGRINFGIGSDNRINDISCG